MYLITSDFMKINFDIRLNFLFDGQIGKKKWVKSICEPFFFYLFIQPLTFSMFYQKVLICHHSSSLLFCTLKDLPLPRLPSYVNMVHFSLVCWILLTNFTHHYLQGCYLKSEIAGQYVLVRISVRSTIFQSLNQQTWFQFWPPLIL